MPFGQNALISHKPLIVSKIERFLLCLPTLSMYMQNTQGSLSELEAMMARQ